MEAITIEEFNDRYKSGMKSKRGPGPEAKVQRAIMEFLQYHPKVAFAFRLNAGMIRTENGGMVRLAPAGVSDIIGMTIDGHFFAVEVKAGKNRPTPRQQEFVDQVNKDGGLAFVAWSVDDCIEVLGE